MDEKNYKIPNVITAKVAFVGDSQVGKSALAKQLVSDGTNYPKNYIMTIGLELSVKAINIPDTNDVVELYLMDCSGREIYKEMLMESILDQTDLIVASFDVSSEETFNNASEWIETLNGKDSKLPGVLLANKTDLGEVRRRVSPKMGLDLATKHGLQYFETSAKEPKGVDDPFYYLANEWHKRNT